MHRVDKKNAVDGIHTKDASKRWQKRSVLYGRDTGSQFLCGYVVSIAILSQIEQVIIFSLFDYLNILGFVY